MPIAWGKLEVPVPFAWAGQQGTVKYRPAATSGAWIEAVESGGKIGDLLAEIVTWIDVVDDAGKNLSPASDDTDGWKVFFRQAPGGFRRAVWRAVWEDMFPDA